MKKLLLGIPVMCALFLTSCNKNIDVPNGYSMSVIPYYTAYTSIDSAQAYIRADTSSDLTIPWTKTLPLYSAGGVLSATFYNLQPGLYKVYMTGKSNTGKFVSGTTVVNLIYNNDVNVVLQ